MKIEKVDACYRSVLSLFENLTHRTICSCGSMLREQQGFFRFSADLSSAEKSGRRTADKWHELSMR
ncbi:hypothetical protein ACWFOB_22605, partial [Bacillus subtilis]